MNNSISERASFWRETMRDLVPFIKAEWQWVIIFSTLAAIAQILAFMSFDTAQIVEQLRQAEGDTAKSFEIILKDMPAVALATFGDICILALSTYVFAVLYLKKFAKADVSFSVRSFFFWLGKVLQKFLIIIFPLFVATGVYGLAVALHVPEVVQLIAGSFFFGVFLFWLVHLFYRYYSLFLVTPLALLGGKPVLQTSAEMTKNQILRICVDHFVLLMILFVLFSPFFYLQMVLAKMPELPSFVVQDLLALIQGIWVGIKQAAVAVFLCTVYRILKKEQKG